MKKLLQHLLVVSVLVCLVIGFSSQSIAKPVKFKAVAFLPSNNIDVKGFNIFIDMINEKFKEHINIELLGGPEVTPPFQLHEAVRKGVIDMCQTSPAYYPSLVWEAQSFMFTNKDRQERYAAGVLDVMRKLHEDAGLVLIGYATYEEYFHIYTNKPVKRPQDLSGQKIRVFPAFIPLIKALGATPVNLPMGDIYTAMERGAVDGFVMTHMGFVKDWSWHEVTKYALDYDIYAAASVILCNPKKWDRIPLNIRKEMDEFRKQKIDIVVEKFYRNAAAERWKMLVDSGVKTVKFSPGDEKAFLKLAYDSAWDYVIAKSPDLGPKLEKMLVKE